MGALTFLAEHWKLITGITGWILAIAGFMWKRKESRLHALEGVLRHLIEAAQALNTADGCRRKCEAIKRSYPDLSQAPEAARSFQNSMQEYDKYMDIGSMACKAVEREFGATQFRFPDRVAKMLRSGVEDVTQAGRYLNGGHTELVEVQIAKVKDHYRAIGRYARGWRLNAPFEGLRRRFKKRQAKEPELPLSDKEFEEISMLVADRLLKYGDQSYVVHPPKCLIDDPSLQESEDVVEKLKDSVFEVVFQDGNHHLMGLPHILVFTYLILVLAVEGAKAMKTADIYESPVTLNLSMDVVPDELMRPEMAKALLSKITFSSEPSDG